MRVLALLAGVISVLAAPARLLPPGVVVHDLVSSSGTVYLAGEREGRAYLARVTKPGELVEVPVDAPGALTAVAADSTGAVYVAGSAAVDERARVFVQKYEAGGRRSYSAWLTGEMSMSARSLAVNARAEVVVNGQLFGSGGNTGYVAKLDAEGGPAGVLQGVGYGKVAFGPGGSVFVAGVGSTLGTTEAPFQKSHVTMACAGSGIFGFACPYQHVAKLSADLHRVEWATLLTGDHGATPSALVISDSGEAIVAGTTNSPDYPTTAGTLQPDYRAAAQPRTSPVGRPMVIPPAASGYVSKLNADGSGLVWSTFFSGTGAEHITGMEVGASGELVLAGLTASRDLPGGGKFPHGCAPMPGRELPFTARLAADGKALIDSGLVWGFAGDSWLGVAGGWLVSSRLGRLNEAAEPLCVLDPADWTLANEIVPGQALALIGDFEPDRLSIRFGDAEAEILYRSAAQVNVRVPLEFVGESVTVTTGDIVLERELRRAESKPRAFLSDVPFDIVNPGLWCGGSGFAPAYQPIARNEDGSLNSCEQPAPRGSAVTLYFNGVGAMPEFSLPEGSRSRIESAEPDPDSEAGVWRVRIRMPDNMNSGSLQPLINGQPARYGWLAVWVK